MLCGQFPVFAFSNSAVLGKRRISKLADLRNQDTAILLDGVRFRDASSITGDASAFLSDFVFTDTGRVEILRGSGSSLYGTNAIGGVLDFRTKNRETVFTARFLAKAEILDLKEFSEKFPTELINSVLL